MEGIAPAKNLSPPSPPPPPIRIPLPIQQQHCHHQLFIHLHQSRFMLTPKDDLTT
nr:unnamed protein product [Digitaria exilis]